MKIAQIAPLMERVPPRFYGGTERIVSYLTEELVRQGHEVTLFASGDSLTAARLVPCCREALRRDARIEDVVPHMMLMLELVRQRADAFDIFHFHIDCIQMPLLRALDRHAVTTLHGRLDLPDLQPFYQEFHDTPLVSISFDQRRPMPSVNWVGNVHHGLPPGLYTLHAAPSGDYLAFLGRISPEKRPDRAMEISRRAGIPLRIAGKVDKVDRGYFARHVAPLLDSPLVRFVGEIGDAEKAEFLGNACALLFPIDWPEPFGIVMIEAMACGTPVVAFRSGSVEEVVEDGVTGFIVDDIDGAAAAVRRLGELDRAEIRRRFEMRFSVGRMVEDYLGIYGRLIGDAPMPRAA